MRIKSSLTALVFGGAILTSLAAKPAADQTALVKEFFFTTDQSRENIDSPAFWSGPKGRNLLFATSKEGHSVNVFDAENGAMIRRVGGLGLELGQFNRPNGVAVVDDYLLVVERDNQRVQILSIPDMIPLASFGEDELRKPYGLYVQPLGDGNYHVYVTDNYETPEEETPPDHELDRRVRRYLLETAGATAEAELDLTFGDTSGDGRLFVVESIYGDPTHDHILVAEELEDDQRGRQVKVYDFAGSFTGKTFGRGIFKSQVEGIALYQSSETAGYWIVTDQSKTRNRFHVFDRETFEYLGAFEGERTLNTDGVWLTQTAMPRFPKAAFYACDNDRAVSAFGLAEVFAALKLDL